MSNKIISNMTTSDKRANAGTERKTRRRGVIMVLRITHAPVPGPASMNRYRFFGTGTFL